MAIFIFDAMVEFLASPLSKAEAKEELQHVHNLTCGDNVIIPFRRLERQSYYKLKMTKEQLTFKRVCEMPRVPCYREVFVHLRSQRLEATIP